MEDNLSGSGCAAANSTENGSASTQQPGVVSLLQEMVSVFEMEVREHESRVRSQQAPSRVLLWATGTGQR